MCYPYHLDYLATLPERPLPKPAPPRWTGELGDFWNDPHRWDAITDTHRELFWMQRARDVIDVSRPLRGEWAVSVYFGPGGKWRDPPIHNPAMIGEGA